ncbi:MAG: class I SAM-dependent methyltransferase [Nitrospinaceae bacterium]|jgi:SAM-dependent methyltransferase|nr:class I SAM-dependent methyltransferase [Nitrospinaceae bacterium]MBT3823251.1 class I SAM-dependent methyltransferase [Nitrospinaceae bacterium]MBT4430766.1 class I SAM-dependent methyltransferase [Nitrospinaceae bacterium]MBT5369444.1 class I SAM-dependent methyltransferase [Nitrospinaceae bacterium]
MGLWSKFMFPIGMDWIMGGPQFQAEREKSLVSAQGEVLELGFGTGLNLPHYPESVDSLYLVDPEVFLPRRVEKRIAAVRMPVRREATSAEELPFEADRFDCVVSTWTLCAISDLDSALKEVVRVLKPEGKFIFLEHGRSDDVSVARWQDRLNPIQRICGCGCNMNRKIDTFICDAGLEIETIDRFLMPRLSASRGRCIVVLQGEQNEDSTAAA